MSVIRSKPNVLKVPEVDIGDASLRGEKLLAKILDKESSYLFLSS